jgi:hypothetical protein
MSLKQCTVEAKSGRRLGIRQWQNNRSSNHDKDDYHYFFSSSSGKRLSSSSSKLKQVHLKQEETFFSRFLKHRASTINLIMVVINSDLGFRIHTNLPKFKTENLLSLQL